MREGTMHFPYEEIIESLENKVPDYTDEEREIIRKYCEQAGLDPALVIDIKTP